MNFDVSLPEGWQWVPLGELLAGIETGKSFKCEERPPSENEIGVVKVSAVSWGEYQELESKTCLVKERVNPAFFVQKGDFLFSRANTVELVGACVIAKQVSLRVMLSDKILRFRFARESMNLWVLHLLQSTQGRLQIEALASGNQESMRNIGQGSIGQIGVPLPPAAEQTRIVAKLEELLSDLDAGVAELKAAQKKLAQYRQSLLKAAVEGALTADWRQTHASPTVRAEPVEAPSAHSPSTLRPFDKLRTGQAQDRPSSGRTGVSETGAALLKRILTERRARWQARQLAKFTAQGKTPPKDWQAKYPEPVVPDTTGLPELPQGWVWASVEQLGAVQLGRQRSPGKLIGLNPAPYIRAANITEQGINFSDVLEMDFTESERETFQLKSGDVLLTEASGSPQHVGRPVIWPNVDGLYCFQNTVIRFSPQGISSEFAFHLFLAWQKLGIFRNLSGGVGINHLSAGKFSTLAVPLPPVAEQTELVRALSVAFESLASQEQTIDYSLQQSTAQRKNILQAAFCGQLVPQDPADEPASALLARIRAERAGRDAIQKPRSLKARKAV